MKVEYEKDFRPGDLVEPDLQECQKHLIRFRVWDWPWVVKKVVGLETVVVERRGRQETWHIKYLKKVGPE